MNLSSSSPARRDACTHLGIGVLRGCEDVAFEMECHDAWNHFGWNVLVKGSTVEAGTLEGELAIAGRGRLGPWTPGDRSLTIRLLPRSLGGRRVSLR